QVIQLSLISLILFLSGFRDYSNLMYAVLISFFLLFCYLAFHYYQRRHVYQKLSKRATDLEQLLEKTDDVPIGQAFDYIMKTQYQLLMEQLKTAEDDQTNHLKFIDRWVHQMKTPRSVIELTAQEFDEHESSSLMEETERMKNGVNTVWYMARMRTIQDDFEIRPVQLETIIPDVDQDNKRFYIRNDVYPHISFKANNVTVETDETSLF